MKADHDARGNEVIKTILMLLSAFLLCGCGHTKEPIREITVLVESGEHYSLDESILHIEPGATAVFFIDIAPGFELTAVDYRGEYRISPERGKTKLELFFVQFPTRVRLGLTDHAVSIVYRANGGEALTEEGDEVAESCDLSRHLRPNTSIGTDLFIRDGYTQTGWNTQPDGSGLGIGLGSRVTVDGSLTLYSQWAAWTPADRFQYRIEDGGAVITACTETGSLLVVPEQLDGYPVTALASGAFRACPADAVILPKSLLCIEEDAFFGAALSELCFFDNLERFSDTSFTDCQNLSTLRINAIEDPYGYSFRRESVLADKYDLLILTAGQNRLIFYGGCSMWYNLIGEDVKAGIGDRYTIVNMAVNGLSNSLLQMEIMRCLMTENDILIHAPEISSPAQLMTDVSMNDDSDKLWCALEYNYDLLSLVDIRLLDGGVFNSLKAYLDRKKTGGSYADVYRDSRGNAYLDDTGCIPFTRTHGLGSLSDAVRLEPDMLSDLSRLEWEYARFSEKGISVYVTHTCIDIDRVPAEERKNAERMGALFTERFSAMEGVTVFGDIRDFLYHDPDFYDTVYHLLTEPARRCTGIWMRELSALLQTDGQREAAP